MCLLSVFSVKKSIESRHGLYTVLIICYDKYEKDICVAALRICHKNVREELERINIDDSRMIRYGGGLSWNLCCLQEDL